MGWFPLRRGRRRTPFNNLGPNGLTCGAVTPQLHVGGELGPRDVHALVGAGISVIINLQQEQQDIFARDERLDGYLWLPAPDGQAPTLEQLHMGVGFLRGAISNGKGVFVHCKAGQGRAPLLCACYLIQLGHSPLQAMALLRAARPATMLTGPQNLALREFAARYGPEVEDPAEMEFGPLPVGEAVAEAKPVADPPARPLAKDLPVTPTAR